MDSANIFLYRYPYKGDTISNLECFAIWAVLVIIMVGIVETFSFVVFRPLDDQNSSQCKIPILALELYRIYAYYTMGGIFEHLIVSTSKYTVGRLRPHFFEGYIDKVSHKKRKDLVSGLFRVISNSISELGVPKDSLKFLRFISCSLLDLYSAFH